MITLLIKSSFIIILLLTFYKLFLEKESFFSVNRFYLLTCLGLTFLLPFIVLPRLVTHQGYVESLIPQEITKTPEVVTEMADLPVISTQKNAPVEKNIIPKEINPTIPTIEKELIDTPEISQHNNKFEQLKSTLIAYLQEHTLADWLLLFYFFGVAVLSLNLLAQLSSMVFKIFRNEDKIVDDDGIIVNMNAIIEPCSFFNYIFINPASYDFDTYEQIITHEKIHVEKGHTFDLLLAELAVIVLWFNPFIWLFRKEIEKNIEYQTDDLVIKSVAAEKEIYQMSLLKIATYNKPMTVVTNYNQSLIKQRILKMNSKKSTQFSYWKYAFIAPLVFTLLLVLNKPFSVVALTPIETIETVVTPKTTNSKATEIPVKKPNGNKAEKEINGQSVAEKKLSDAVILPETASKTDCEKLLNAAKAGNLNQVRKLLTKFNPECMPYGNEQDYKNMKQVRQSAKNNGEITIDDLQKVILIAIDKGYAIINLNELVVSENDFNRIPNNYTLQVTEGPSRNVRVHRSINTNGGSKVYHFDGYDGPIQIDVNDGKDIKITSLSDRGEDTYSYDNDCIQLLKAVRNQENEKVKELLKTVDPNCVNPKAEYEEKTVNGHTWRMHKARTPLVAAARNGNFAGAKLLIAAGAKVKFHHRHDESALIGAAEFGDLVFVKFLLDEGADLNESSNGWGSPLNAAARGGHEEIVAFLLDKGADIDEQTNGQGSALNAAARKGHLAIVQLLMERGANVNLQNNGQGSPLNAAARNGHSEIIKLLVEKGANIDAETNGQGSALNAAARNGNMEVVQLLIDLGADLDVQNNGQGSALNAAARNGHHDIVKLLIKKGADIDLQTNGQGSALNAAARNGDLETVKWLIELGADLNVHSNGQGSALNAAARNGHHDIIKLLVEKGADIDAETNGQGSALNAAARNGHLKTVQLLIDLGADLDVQNNGQGSALNAAARNGHLETIKLLLDNGANINMQNNGQGSALNAAARNGHESAVKLLLERGAKVNAMTNGQNTALMAATRNRHYDTVELLLKAGADPYLSPNRQETPLGYAHKQKNKRLIKLMEAYKKAY